MRRASLLVLLPALLAGCAAIAPPQPPAAATPAAPLTLTLPAPKARATGGGVYVAGRAGGWLADTRQFRPGDVLTVVLQETTQASKRADTQLGKQSDAGLAASLNSKSRSASLGLQREFNGSAASSQQNTLQGAITVVVHEVLGNGLLRVAGEKSLYLNQGEEVMQVAGYVRASDVDGENRVSSQRIANARISYSGRGHLADANTPGWLMRWFVSGWSPL